eukprot:UN28601
MVRVPSDESMTEIEVVVDTNTDNVESQIKKQTIIPESDYENTVTHYDHLKITDSISGSTNKADPSTTPKSHWNSHTMYNVETDDELDCEKSRVSIDNAQEPFDRAKTETWTKDTIKLYAHYKKEYTRVMIGELFLSKKWMDKNVYIWSNYSYRMLMVTFCFILWRGIYLYTLELNIYVV